MATCRVMFAHFDETMLYIMVFATMLDILDPMLFPLHKIATGWRMWSYGHTFYVGSTAARKIWRERQLVKTLPFLSVMDLCEVAGEAMMSITGQF